MFWEVPASPVCWLKTGRKNKIHVRRSGIKQPPPLLFALTGQRRGDNYISEKFPAHQTPDGSRWSLAGSPVPQIPCAARRIKNSVSRSSLPSGCHGWDVLDQYPGQHWDPAGALPPSAAGFSCALGKVYPLPVAFSKLQWWWLSHWEYWDHNPQKHQ